ncbi:MAG TPA: phage major capsid protein [Acidimicrobiales bacterium]|nr:phage major capsid protein [Acidimicrobiales bacterium]
MNAVLDRLVRERHDQTNFIDQLLARVEEEGRDLVDAEQSNLTAARERIEQLDAQIKPLEDYEARKAAHVEVVSRLPGPERPDHNGGQPRRMDGSDRGPDYRTAGHFIVDLLASRGMLRQGDSPDPGAAQRIAQARANQTTTDTPGILPTPIVGGVVNLIDANRPLITSLGGALPMGGIPGKTFSRPKITTHTTVGAQATEKTALSSQAMKIDPIVFNKGTYGGFVDISRQDIDFTSPGAWDILVRDLADVYSVTTETAVATAFKAATTATAITVADADLPSWSLALYKAAASSYATGKRMPDRLWVSLNVWAVLGALTDSARLILPPIRGVEAAGESELGSFRGDVLGLPRIVVPTFADNTCIIGPSSLFEVYEEVIGLLSVIEPSILGVTVAYGGYTAWGTLAGGAFVPVTPPADTVSLAELIGTPETAANPGPKAAK